MFSWTNLERRVHGIGERRKKPFSIFPRKCSAIIACHYQTLCCLLAIYDGLTLDGKVPERFLLISVIVNDENINNWILVHRSVFVLVAFLRGLVLFMPF